MRGQATPQDTRSVPKMSKPTSIHYRIPLRGLKVSTNKIYAGEHWTKRKQLKDSLISVAGYFCRPVQRIESYPVEISYRFIFGTRALDTLNCAYMAKMFEDALRSFEILKDDDPKCVARSIIEVVALPPEKRPKTPGTQSKASDAEDKDWLELTITSIV